MAVTGRRWRPWSLRRRLLAALVGLAATGLSIFAVAAVVALDRSLTARADSLLVEMAHGAQRSGRSSPPPEDRSNQLPTDFAMQHYDATGRMTWAIGGGEGGPDVGDAFLRSSATTPTQLSDRSGGAPWRAMVMRFPDGDCQVLAVSLESEQATVQRLIYIEIGAGLPFWR